MKMRFLAIAAGLALMPTLAAPGFTSAAFAQMAVQPPMNVQGQMGVPDQSAGSDPADLVLRVGRLEDQMRRMAGQIEQLQFENRKLTETLRKFQEDVDFRFQERGGRKGAGAPSQPARPLEHNKRSDAFDPAEHPGAPGAPMPLGSSMAGGSEPRGMPQAALGGGGSLSPRGETSIAAASTGDPRQDYEAAYAEFLNRQYDQAEMGFRRFLQSYPRDKLAPDATYWLGESYYLRQRYREAAEQFLKVTTSYPKSDKGAGSLLKLGMSLNGIGAHDEACATFSEMGRRFPNASADVKQATVRERRRAKC